MQGPGGNVSRGLPSGPASTVASGAGRCESGALMHSFGIFLQGLLGVVAFSTLMRESGTPAPPRPHVDRRSPSPTPGTLLPLEFRPGHRALGLRCLPLPRDGAGYSRLEGSPGPWAESFWPGVTLPLTTSTLDLSLV